MRGTLPSRAKVVSEVDCARYRYRSWARPPRPRCSRVVGQGGRDEEEENAHEPATKRSRNGLALSRSCCSHACSVPLCGWLLRPAVHNGQVQRPATTPLKNSFASLQKRMRHGKCSRSSVLMRRRFDEDLSPSYDSSCDSCSGFFRLCKRTGNDHYHYYPERNYALNFWRILRTGQTAESSRGIFLPEVIAQALFSRQTNGYSSMQLLLLAAAPPALLPIC